MAPIMMEFGFYPAKLDIAAGPVSVRTLPDHAKSFAVVTESEGIENDWIYAPPQEIHQFGGMVHMLPYPSRVFGLPKTHIIEHAHPDSDGQLTFHIWALSFFLGIRLTATEAGFLDATPIKPGKLVDFILFGNSLEKAINLAESFWMANRGAPENAQRFAAAIHALFIGHNPRYLQFERFIYLYAALDACFTLAASLHSPPRRLSHADRLAWVCGLFGMNTPSWADSSIGGHAEIATIRNATIHEALFMGEPLGFGLHGVGINQNLTIEMEALICRFLVALSGGQADDYVRSPINTRSIYGLELR